MSDAIKPIGLYAPPAAVPTDPAILAAVEAAFAEYPGVYQPAYTVCAAFALEHGMDRDGLVREVIDELYRWAIHRDHVRPYRKNDPPTFGTLLNRLREAAAKTDGLRNQYAAEVARALSAAIG